MKISILKLVNIASELATALPAIVNAIRPVVRSIKHRADPTIMADPAANPAPPATPSVDQAT